MIAARDHILERSVPVPFVGCWLWLLSYTQTGYGQTNYRGRIQGAHRLSYSAFKGPIPQGAFIQHSCDTPWCVNPDHLSAGTAATNNYDKQCKGRAAFLLTPEQVLDIRSSADTDTVTAERFSVSRSMINKIELANAGITSQAAE